MSKLKEMDGLFNGRHFDREVIVLCVRWYLRYKLSLRDLVQMMAERDLSLAHTTIMRWVKRFTPVADDTSGILESRRQSTARSLFARFTQRHDQP
ncbi:hypothetical protein LMG28614_00871 [Paraburkholderia ultramafica]|uniref:Transposase n=1 Tax=Paraburkholderia ultramafica TaxID=1544867 RepID=A0A6S7AVZ0_9BURK|nr:hypothetical protein LMG28614_00871 [Paraburkholderia ultramafica]